MFSIYHFTWANKKQFNTFWWKGHSVSIYKDFDKTVTEEILNILNHAVLLDGNDGVARQAKKMKTEELAEKVNIAVESIGHIECGAMIQKTKRKIKRKRKRRMN